MLLYIENLLSCSCSSVLDKEVPFDFAYGFSQEALRTKQELILKQSHFFCINVLFVK